MPSLPQLTRVVTLAVLLALPAGCSPSRPTAGTLPGIDDVPLYPRALLRVAERGLFAYTMPVEAGTVAITTFYRREMPAREWHLAADHGSVLVFEKPNRSATVTVSDLKRPAVLLISVGGPVPTTTTTTTTTAPAPAPSARPTPRASVGPTPLPRPSASPSPRVTPAPGSGSQTSTSTTDPDQ